MTDADADADADAVFMITATDYLVTGGWLMVAFNIVPFIYTVFLILSLSDGKISDSEGCVLSALGCIRRLLPLISFGVTIWVRNYTNEQFDVDFFLTSHSKVRSV